MSSVRPSLAYCSSVWDPHTSVKINQLEVFKEGLPVLSIKPFPEKLGVILCFRNLTGLRSVSIDLGLRPPCFIKHFINLLNYLLNN